MAVNVSARRCRGRHAGIRTAAPAAPAAPERAVESSTATSRNDMRKVQFALASSQPSLGISKPTLPET
jgi:hypothetical protein